MNSKVIVKRPDFKAICLELRNVQTIAFDTEFVAEHTFKPQLCLLQVATENHLLAFDPLALGDISQFWELLAEGEHETIVHAGREEMNFCADAVGAYPKRLIDVQIASGLVGSEYPAGYSTLTNKLLGVQTGKGETRTDWRKRPLSNAQIDYALDDVRYLQPIRGVLERKLEGLNRQEWLDEEMRGWLQELEEARSRQRWRRVSGSGGLPPRTLAIIRELWDWREKEAERRDWPARRVLRDDLIVEIAKRRVTDPKHVLAVRGLERSHLNRAADDLVQCVERALALPEMDLPTSQRQENSPQLTMLGQFLSSALNSICRQAQVATSMVGNPTDVRDLVAHRLSKRRSSTPPPRLTQGWRADVVGNLLDDLLSGKVTIRISDPSSEQPLVFEPFADGAP